MTVTVVTTVRTTCTVVLVTRTGLRTNHLCGSTTDSGVGYTLVAVAVVTTLRTTGVGVLVAGAGQRTDPLGITRTVSAVGRTLVTERLLRTAVVVTTVGARCRAPGTVHTNVDTSAVTQLHTVSEVASIQATVTEVTCTAIATGLVAAPLVTGRSGLTDLLNRARALSTSRCTGVAVTVVTAVGAVTNLSSGPLVTGEGCDTALDVAAVTASVTRSTGVAVAVVAAEGAAANLAGCVTRTVVLTSLNIATRASLGSSGTSTTACRTSSTRAQVTRGGTRQTTGELHGVVTEGASSRTVGATDVTVTVPCSTTSVVTGCLAIPDVSSAGSHTELDRVTATAISPSHTSVTVTVGTSRSATVGVVVSVSSRGRHTDLLGRATTHSCTRCTSVAVTAVATLRTASVGVHVTRRSQATNPLGRTATCSAVGRTLVTERALYKAAVVTTVGTSRCAPASVHTDVHVSTVTCLRTMSIARTVQATVTVVTRTSIATSLVVVPLVTQ